MVASESFAEFLREQLAPVGRRALRDARGALLFATGTSLPQRQRGILFARRSTGHGEETASSGKNSLATCGAIKERRTAFQLRTKNRQITKNDHLTGKAPYKFGSDFLQRRVRCEPDFLDYVGADALSRP